MRRLLVNTYTEAEVRIWCRLFWSKTEDLDIEELQESLIQYDIEPEEPPKPKLFKDLLGDLNGRGHFTPAPDPWPEAPKYLPPWYKFDVCQEGLTTVIDPSSYSWPNHDLDSWAIFAMHHGIAPFQPFLLSLPKPHYSKSYSDWGYEYDCEYYHDVVALQPLSEKQKLKRWEDYLKSVELEIPWVSTPPSSY